MVITIIIAIVHQHATKDSQELLIPRLSILGEGLYVFSYYLSPSCQVNCTPALICKTKRPGHKSTTKQRNTVKQKQPATGKSKVKSAFIEPFKPRLSKVKGERHRKGLR